MAVLTPPEPEARALDVPAPTAAGGRTAGLVHIRALDGLRGLAVAGVVAYHLGYLQGGFLGVDAFFVLSGFLITSLLVVEHRHHGRIDLRAFWVRRGRRLLPALAVLLAAVAVYAIVAADQDEGRRVAGDVLATAGYAANWHLAVGDVGYFEQFASPSLLSHAWSLAIEEQFYVVWPLVVAGLLTWRRGRTAALAVVVVGLAAASAVLMAVLHQPGQDTSRVYYGTDTRAAGLLIGAAVALLMARPPGWLHGRVGRAVAGVLAAVSLAVLAVAWAVARGRDDWLYQGGFAVLELCVAALIVAVVVGATGPAAPLRRLLELAPLCWLGLVSYGLYLWHWPVIVWLSPERTGWDGPALLGARLAAMLALTVASAWLVERHYRHALGAGRRGRRRVAGTALAAVAAVAVGVAAVAVLRPPSATASRLAGGFVPLTPTTAASTSSPTTAERARPTVADAPAADIASATTPAPAPPTAPAPVPTAPPSPRRALVVGDSTATTLALAAEAGATGDFVVASDTQVGCGLAPGRPYADGSLAGRSGCDRWYQRWRDSIAQVRPDVTVVMFGPWDLLDRLVDGAVVPFGSPTWQQLATGAIGDALDTASSGGAPVAVLDVPCYASRVDAGPDAKVRDDPTRAHALNTVLAQVVASRPAVTMLPVSEFLCPRGQFEAELDGVPLRPDGVHLTEASSALLWQTWLAGRLDALLAGAPAA